MMMNQDKYNKLSAQDKAAVDKLSGETLARMQGRGWDKVDREGKALMQAAGVNIQPANAAFIKEVESRVAQFEQKWVTDATAKGIKNPQNVIKEFRAEIKKL